MITNIPAGLGELSDGEVLSRVRAAAHDERSATVRLIALLMELDTRRLYLGEGYSSLFTYCTQVLHLSEHAAYNRIETARAARRFPVILELVESAAVTLTTVRLLAPHLTDANHRDVLERARHKSKREVELLVTTLNPRPDVPSTVRKLPAPALPKLPPAAPDETHTVPNGDPAIIFERALVLLVAELERTKLASTQRPRTARSANPTSRHIPAAVKRSVWQRDDGRCAFKGPHGRCAETGFLEYHHVVPFASGGETSATNLELRCRAHNQYEAEQWFGPGHRPQVRERRALFGA